MFDSGRHSSPTQPHAATVSNGSETAFSLGTPFSPMRCMLTFCYVLAMVSFVLVGFGYY
jgi:hypothetical protein